MGGTVEDMYSHNLTKKRECDGVATEVSSCELLRFGVPYWKMLSWAEDLWCIKRLGEDYSDTYPHQKPVL